MKKRLFVITSLVVATLIVCAAIFTGCSCSTGLTDDPLAKTVIADFTKEDGHSETFESNGWENGEPFNVRWNADNVSYADNKLALSVSEMTETYDNGIAEYYGGEVRTSHFYGYGDFKVRMKPAKIAGTASTFFTCTGPYDVWYNEDGTEKRKNDHDEIDIEFLGSDTTKVQFNYFANGVGGHEKMIDLGFDASEEFHDYGFRWTKDDITWFVDDKPVYKVYRLEIKEGEEWPEEPGRVLMNYWAGTEKASAWMGEFKDDYSGKAEYEWAATTAAPQIDPASTKPEDKSEPIPADIAWDADTILPFGSTDVYTVTTDDTAKTQTVTYTAATTNKYSNITAQAQAPGKNYFGITLASKTDKPIAVRVSLMDAADAQLAKKAYVSDGKVNIEGGANLTVPANGSVDLVIYYEGAISKAEIMIDSLWAATDVVSANTLELSHTKFGVKGEVVEPEPAPEDTLPDTPVFPAEGKGIDVIESVTFTSDKYTITKAEDNSTLNVAYTDILGKSYATLNGDISAVIADSNALTFKVKNNGTEKAKIRADIVCPKGNGTNGDVFCNVKAAVSGAAAAGNDYQYGGADWLEIEIGATATVTVHFKTNVGANGITFFVDSSTYNDETTHTGAVEFSEMSLFKYEG